MLLIKAEQLILEQVADPSSSKLLPINIFWIIIGIVAVFITILIIISILINKPRKEKKEVIKPSTNSKGTSAEKLAELNKDIKPYGFAYDRYEDVFYSLMDCWQRDMGYCRLYDESCASISLIVDCDPIRFEYNDKKWLIEFWKGQYGMTTGGEVGIYYTEGPEINIPGVFNGTFYHSVSDKDRINMAFAFRKNNELLFTRSGFHWWLTGFKLGEFSQPSELSMDIILELYDKPMCNAFVAALKKAGYTSKEFTVSGRIVNINFDKPHTSQPYTRTSFIEYLMQKNNEALCDTYQKMTDEYTDTLDKLEVIRNQAPKMYRQVLNPGKSPQVFDSFNKIKGFLTKTDEKREE